VAPASARTAATVTATIRPRGRPDSRKPLSPFLSVVTELIHDLWLPARLPLLRQPERHTYESFAFWLTSFRRST
jgi:hypothetical protein